MLTPEHYDSGAGIRGMRNVCSGPCGAGRKVVPPVRLELTLDGF